MKGISLCADCAYYDLKKHKCNRGATVDPDISKGQDVRFYVDCPLDDAEPVKHGHWILTQDEQYEYCRCSECGYDTGENWMIGSEIKYCANCGAKMDGGADNG